MRKARARRNFTLAKQLAARAPGYKLDHLVRERYPAFIDALRDLDDALCMVHLFATLPGDEAQAIPAEMVHTSRRLVLEWQALLCRTAALRKSFISVKGFYFQARPLPGPHHNLAGTLGGRAGTARSADHNAQPVTGDPQRCRQKCEGRR